MSTLTVYGIPNCDTVKKARAWLAEQGMPCQFHDFKKQGVPEAELERWLQAAERAGLDEESIRAVISTTLREAFARRVA